MRKFGVSDVDQLDGFGRPTKKEKRKSVDLWDSDIPKRSFFSNFRLCILVSWVYPIYGRQEILLFWYMRKLRICVFCKNKRKRRDLCEKENGKHVDRSSS